MNSTTGTGRSPWPSFRSGMARGRPAFLARTATDNAEQLKRRSSIPTAVPEPLVAQGLPSGGPQSNVLQPESRTRPSLPRRRTTSPHIYGHLLDGGNDTEPRQDAVADQPQPPQPDGQFLPVPDEGHDNFQSGKQKEIRSELAKTVEPLRPAGVAVKLGTFSGVFVPTTINVLSILMFIRFGFILGQSGVIGMLGMLIAAYVIDLITTLSISAVASNGTVRGGGAYYLISRSLGPEFGGAIGIVSYMGFVFNTGMNAVGLIDCLIYNFGSESGSMSNILPEGQWWQYLWTTVTVAVCVLICLAGSAIFAKVSNALLVVLLIATFSIPLSVIIMQPFEDVKRHIEFTGFSLQTLRGNLLPHFTRGAAGSKMAGRENYQDLFGVLFPATCGILAGASMSGDLKNPSKSIPRGTLAGLGLTFISYTIVIVSLAASITRQSFYRDVNVVQDVNASGILILAGEVSSTFFSVLMGIVGPSKQLQAIARDKIIPGLSIFAPGRAKTDDPILAILMTFIVAQLVLLLDINKIASLITMTYLMTFFALNVATFLLKIGSAPNFRPSFRYFSWASAAAGAVLSVSAMFFVDGISASGSVCILLLLIAVIHYTTPPKPWGSISEVLIYHQVRKYLLKLRTEHVKFWRPQILLFINDPRRNYKLIQFCNSLKKGGLYILGHVIVTQNFGASVPEVRKQQSAWTKYIDFSHIKAFVNVAISPSIEWGTRNIVLSAGLGGMRPNIVVFGVYNLQQFRNEQPQVPSPPPEPRDERRSRKRARSRSQIKGELPTDTCFVEKQTDLQSYVMVLEDMILKLKTNVAVAAGFGDLELPSQEGNSKRYIDLWPIQMTAEVEASGQSQTGNVRTTNFDTYTMILQLGCILNTVPSWKKAYTLRVAVFVEYESDVEEERARVKSLLEGLRIKAKVLVFWLASTELKTYQLIVNGEEVDAETEAHVDKALEKEAWWEELRKYRGKLKSGDMSTVDAWSLSEDIHWGSPGLRGRRDPSLSQFGGLRKILGQPRQHSRSSFGHLFTAGLSLSMRTSRIDDDMLSRHTSNHSDSEYSSSELDGINSDEGYHDDSGSEDFDGDEASSGSRPKSRLSSRKSSKKSSRASSLRVSRRKKLLDSSNLEGNLQDGFGDESSLLIDLDDQPVGRSTRPRTSFVVPASSATRPRSPIIELNRPSLREAAEAHEEALEDSSDNAEGDEMAGPSIQFADVPHPRRQPPMTLPLEDDNKTSIYQRGVSDVRPAGSSDSPSRSISSAVGSNLASVASGFPSTAAIPLSFNTLPSRAQHLILNELMLQHSDDTAVILTTLPPPSEGTHLSEMDSWAWVSDLEVLYQGLCPCLFVHSNSLTVTMNL
ncbi:hypothetical protein DV736_g1181, partial [Chaetothyriales sp. CBS 134916]